MPPHATCMSSLQLPPEAVLVDLDSIKSKASLECKYWETIHAPDAKVGSREGGKGGGGERGGGGQGREGAGTMYGGCIEVEGSRAEGGVGQQQH